MQWRVTLGFTCLLLKMCIRFIHQKTLLIMIPGSKTFEGVILKIVHTSHNQLIRLLVQLIKMKDSNRCLESHYQQQITMDILYDFQQ
uniref:Secreted protein n=1 Tax=Steinernema glaseri TaxID=37863 RepID=A0A1I8AI56_9BILA